MTADQYLAALNTALDALSPTDRKEAVSEIRQHITDAMSAGRSIDDVLAALGPVDALARGYQLELLVTPGANTPARSTSGRWLKMIGALALVSFPTLIIVVVLGSIGIAFTLAGIGAILAGATDQIGALPSWLHTDLEPWFSIVVGAALTVAGLISYWGTVAYLRFVVRVMKRM